MYRERELTGTRRIHFLQGFMVIYSKRAHTHRANRNEAEPLARGDFLFVQSNACRHAKKEKNERQREGGNEKERERERARARERESARVAQIREVRLAACQARSKDVQGVGHRALVHLDTAVYLGFSVRV